MCDADRRRVGTGQDPGNESTRRGNVVSSCALALQGGLRAGMLRDNDTNDAHD